MKEFLVFWVGDGGDRESYNTYHSNIIQTQNKIEAIKHYIAKRNLVNINSVDEFINENNIKLSDYDTIECDTIRL